MPASERNDDRDPSMEEILSSIRQIISTDGEAGEGLTPEPSERPRGTAAEAGADEPPPADPHDYSDAGPAAGAAEDGSSGDTALEALWPVGGGDAEPAGEPGPGSEEPPAAADGLVSAAAAAASLEALAGLRAAADAAPPAPAGGDGRTVEQLAADLLRPMLKEMLKEWLDSNLPAMVRHVVEDEVRRLSARAHL